MNNSIYLFLISRFIVLFFSGNVRKKIPFEKFLMDKWVDENNLLLHFSWLYS